MTDKQYYHNIPLADMKGPYNVHRDCAGYPIAITRGGYHVLHLATGSVRNDEYLPQVLAALNGDGSSEGSGE